MNDIERSSFPSFETVLLLWATYLHLGERRLTASMLTETWIAALRAAGYSKARKGWDGYGASTRTLPFVIDLPCPFEHRTADRRNLAHLRLIVEDTGWVTVDPDSACEGCCPDLIERWLLTCPRCEADETSRRHQLGHGLRHGFDPAFGVIGSTAPLSFVLDQVLRLRDEAEAFAWLEFPEAAAAHWNQVNADARMVADADRVAERREWARRVLGAATKRPAVTASAAMTTDEAAAWLDKHEVPPTASQREALRLTHGLPGRPAKNTIEAAQSLRKSRATEA